MGKPTEVIIKCRLSYLNAWEPRANKSGKLKYSASLLIPKTDKAQIAEIEKAIKAAEEEGKVKVFKGKPTTGSSFKRPLHDGDLDRPEDAAYAGMMFLNVASNNKPGIVDKNRKPLLDKDELYSGCWAYVAVNMYPFNVESMGITGGLNHIMKWKDDDALAGGGSAESAFSDVKIDEEDFM